MILMIDNYDSFTYNVVQYLGELGNTPEVYRNDKITIEELKEKNFDALVISPGPCYPGEAGISCDAIQYASENNIPVLGICLGHQCIGEVFGGNIVHAPYLMHGKVSEISHDGTGIFKDIPDKFKATRYHSLTIAPDTFPEDLEITAKTEDGIIMGISHKYLPIHGMQFHPESIITEYGHQLIQNFLDIVTLFFLQRSDCISTQPLNES